MIANTPEFHLNMMLPHLMDAMKDTSHTISWKCRETPMQPATALAFEGLCTAIKRLDAVTTKILEEQNAALDSPD